MDEWDENDEVFWMLEGMAKMLPDIDKSIEDEQVRLDALKEYRRCIALSSPTYEEMILAKVDGQEDVAHKKAEELTELIEKIKQLSFQLHARSQLGN